MRAPLKTLARARSLRREMSLPEVILWQELRQRALPGLRFRRQHPVGPYILDFYCPARNLAIEIDGASHDHPQQAAHDARREQWLADRGIRVLRFQAADILSDDTLSDVLDTIIAAGAPSVGFADSSPASGGASQPTAPDEGGMILPRETGEGDHAKHGGGGTRTKRARIHGAPA